MRSHRSEERQVTSGLGYPGARTLEEVRRIGNHDSMMSAAPVASRHTAPRPSFGFLICLPLLLSFCAPVAENAYAQEPASGDAPEDIWSDDYINMIFPWAPANDDILQFKQYHTYETMKTRMMRLAEDNPDIFAFYEGMNGGTNARGEEVTANAYEGWYYGHASPWMKITHDVQGGDYNAFVGDTGNYPERHDVMIVGNHHAREWMSYEVPMMQLEVIAFSYNNIGYDNDGDGLIDEDTWGDSNGDGQLDDDGDCLALASEHQDSNGDGTPCGPGDLGVDEDYSEQFITDLVNSENSTSSPCSTWTATSTTERSSARHLLGKHARVEAGERTCETTPSPALPRFLTCKKRWTRTAMAWT